MTKSEAVFQWLLNCPEIKDLYFAFGEQSKDNTILVPETAYTDEWADGSPWISGCGEKEYTFRLVRFMAVSDVPQSEVNITSAAVLERIAQWIDEQNNIRSYPDFPDNCTINEIKVLPFPNGGLAGRDEKTAKYMFAVKINYLYTKG